MRVLLVDNCITFRDGLQQEIKTQKNMGLSACAASAQEIFDGEIPTAPEVAVIDIDLPDQSGIEVGLWLAQKFPETVILLLSTWDWDVYLAAAYAIRAAGVLSRANPTAGLVKSIQEASYQPIFSADQIQRIQTWRAGPGAILRNLRPREWEVLWLVTNGYSNREIAEAIQVSENTVEKHVTNLLQKFGFSSRSFILAYVYSQHLEVFSRLDKRTSSLILMEQ